LLITKIKDQGPGLS